MKTDYRNIQAPVFNIQTYSIHDGPGIRVTVFVKGCPLRCLWCANPESNLAIPQLMTYANKCTGCGRCVSECPNYAIELRNINDKLVAATNRSMCCNCGKCVSACPNESRGIAGKNMSVSEVLEKVQKDRLFIDSSGGGITVSGGEPLMHPDFTEALLRAAKEDGLHTAIESCSFASRGVVDRVFRYVDLGLLDIKHMDPKEHERLTGVSNNLILENLIHIYHDLMVPFMISIPVIPGYNDSDENIAATAIFISEKLGKDVPVRLLPYHRLGESKNDSLGKPMDFSIIPPSEEHMHHLKELVTAYGLSAQIGG